MVYDRVFWLEILFLGNKIILKCYIIGLIYININRKVKKK